MRRFLLVFAMLAVAVWPAVVHADDTDVTVTNRTGADVYEIRIADPESDSWSENLLSGSLAASESRPVPVPAGTWNVRVLDANGDVVLEEYLARVEAGGALALGE